jgi:hypothetical protein
LSTPTAIALANSEFGVLRHVLAHYAEDSDGFHVLALDGAVTKVLPWIVAVIHSHDGFSVTSGDGEIVTAIVTPKVTVALPIVGAVALAQPIDVP